MSAATWNGHLLDGAERALATLGSDGRAARLAAAGCPVPAVEATARYAWVRHVLEGVVVEPGRLPDHRDRSHRPRVDAPRLGHVDLRGW